MKNQYNIANEAQAVLIEMEKYLATSKIDKITKELIKIRASQINGCAFCLNMHTKDALSYGESAQRIFLLNAWRETKLFSDKEKAVLELVEMVCEVSKYHDFSEVRNNILEYYTKEEFAELLIMITQINTWNRINAVFGNDIDKDYK